MARIDKQRKGRRQRRSFTDDFKAGAVRLAATECKTVGQVARDLDLTESALRLWVERAGADRGQGRPGVLTGEERQVLTRPRKENREPRMERDILSRGLLREGERVRFAFIDAEKAEIPVAQLCRALRVSLSGFYAWSDGRLRFGLVRTTGCGS